MGITDRMNALDRRAESLVSRRSRKYDVEPPNWLKYGGVIFVIAIAALTMMLTVIAGPRVAVVGSAVLLLAWATLLVIWTRRHRVRA